MSSLLCLFAILIHPAGASEAPEVEAPIEAESQRALVRIPLRGAPSFTTQEEPGLFVIDFVGLEASLSDREEIDGPGLVGVESEETPEGQRLKILLAAGAQAEISMEDESLLVRVLAEAEETDPVVAMNAAMEGLASQVARIGEGVRSLTGEEEAEEASEDEPEVAAEIEVEPEHEPEAIAEAVAESIEEVVEEGVEATEPEPAPVVAAPEPEPAPEPVAATPEPEPAVAMPEPELEPEPVVATPEPAPLPPPAPAEVATALASELVRLGFRPTPSGALILLGLEGEIAHRLEQREDMVILELSGTRIRRANDKRPLDTSFFDTPVRSVRAVEDAEARTTRIEIELLRPAEVSVEEGENEIAIALGEAR